MHHYFKSSIVLVLLIIAVFPIQSSMQITSDSPHTIVKEEISNPEIPVFDRNLNKIDDYIDKRNWNGLVEVVVHYQEHLPLPTEVMGQEVKYEFQLSHAVQVDLPVRDIYELSKLSAIDLIEYNHKVSPFLLDSTRHMGLPGSFWSNNKIGANGMSIAIVDSGIDASHIGFNDRIIASYNAINDNSDAVDTVGHGTHVAGIAAGNLSLSNGVYEETQRGMVPPACDESGCSISPVTQLEHMDFSEPITVTLDWGDQGIDNPSAEAGIIIFNPYTDEVPCEIPGPCYFAETDGFLTTTLTIPQDDYYVGVFNNGGPEGEVFEASVSYTRSDVSGNSSFVRGVAYGANIVNVKVLDKATGGDLDSFDRGISWIIDNRETYNISVVNLSLGLNGTSPTLDNMMGTLADNGILPVAAAGNSGMRAGGIFSPASAPEALTVGAINRIGEVTYYTNRGSDSVNGEVSKPDVLAPGGSAASKALGFDTDYELGFGLVASLDASLGYDLQKDDLTGYQGTSMAAPHISGLALLMASELQQTDGWDWNSRESVMKVKRAILSGTYEVANIGNGREQLPGESNPQFPTINRNKKDYHEGWGAVDARAVESLFGDTIDIGYQNSLFFNMNNPDVSNTYSFPMTLQPGTKYGFFVDTPTSADIDIKIVNATGTGADDIGDLSILEYTSKDRGEDEGLGISVDTETDVYVIVTMIQGTSQVSVPFEVVELDDLPVVTITSPFIDQEVTVPLTIEFTGSTDTVEFLLDNVLKGEIQSGHRVFDITLGEHTIDLRFTSSNGITVSDSVTFSIVQDTGSNFLNLPITLFFFTTLMVITIFRRKFSN